jgi:hypothetical protein
MARSASSNADAACPTHLGCSKEAQDQSTRARSLTTGSVVALAAGGAAVASAVILWLTSPKPSAAGQLRVVPIAGASVTGLGATGTF